MGATAEAIPVPPGIEAAGADAWLTSHDTGALLYQLFFLPGDCLVWAVATYLPSVAAFLEIGPADYGGVLAGFVSTCAWILLVVTAAIVYQKIVDADVALTRGVARLSARVVRSTRIARALLASRFRAREKPHGGKIEFGEDIDLSREELRVLQIHGELGPGYALAVSEVAGSLRARVHHAQELLERLTKLQLIESTVGGLDGENAYRLTRAGRAFLIFRQMAPKT
jgi:hypothetical protein